MGDATPAVRCHGLVKRYGDVLAVDRLDLEVAAGECVGLLGPNGAGKTTTIEILEGLLAPDDGRVEILGQRWGVADAALRARLGIHLQETQLDDKLTTGETLRLFRSFYPRGRAVGDVLALLELEAQADRRVGTLSGGQRQRLAVGCALVGTPDLLFLDEPTTGLDPQSRRQLWALLDRFRAAGGTILLTTHYMDEAHVLCDRVAIVDHGRTIAAGAPDALIAGLGAAHVVRFTLGVGDPAARATLGARLADLPDVEAVRQDGEAWIVTASTLHRVVPGLVRVAAETGAALEELTTRTATLEDVFVSLTGRHLRDD